jgi:hypothetical protein
MEDTRTGQMGFIDREENNWKSTLPQEDNIA